MSDLHISTGEFAEVSIHGVASMEFEKILLLFGTQKDMVTNIGNARCFTFSIANVDITLFEGKE
jgi:hypothetical protein